MSDKTKQVSPIVQLKRDIQQAMPQLGLANKKEQERMSSVLMVAVEKDPKLIFADRQSLFSAVRQCASAGLVPDNNYATLQIYNTKVKDAQGNDIWIQKVQYMIMVKGVVKLVHNSGKVDAFWAELVYEGEDFKIDISRGDRRPTHNPDYFNRTGNVVGAYAVAKYSNGSVDCEPMTMAEINKVKGVAKTKNVWEKWFEEKAKVAVMRRLAKRLPLSSEDMAMIMNEQEHDFSQEPPQEPKEKTLAQRLLEGASGHTDPLPASETRTMDGDVEDAELVKEHEFDADAVSPFDPEYTEGLEAQRSGKVESDCPYAPNTMEHNNWLGGWMFAMKNAAKADEKDEDDEDQ